MREGRGQTLADRLKVDLRLSYRCMDQKVSTDFYEGVRALLVDKDNSPKVRYSDSTAMPHVVLYYSAIVIVMHTAPHVRRCTILT